MPYTFFGRTFGNNTGGSTAPPAPTLVVTDHKDGSGATATISGSAAGSANVVNVALWTGANGSLSFVNAGNRTGDGDVTLSLTNGQRVAFVTSTVGALSSESNEYVFTSTGGSNPGSMTGRVDSRLDTILNRIVDRLVKKVDGLSIDLCFLTLHPDDPIGANPGDRFVTVSPLGGRFDEGMIDGGGIFQTTADGGAVVKIHAITQEDEAYHAKTLLTDSTLGLIDMMQRVLAALTVWDADDTVNKILRQPLFPVEYRFSNDGRRMAGVEIDFRVLFDWAIS